MAGFFASPGGPVATADEALADAAARTVEDVDRRERVLEHIVGSAHPAAESALDRQVRV